MSALVAFGSNLGPRHELLERALRLLERDPAVRVTARSTPLRTEPLGPVQPAFLNAVVRLETRHPPEVLLALLQEVERRLGRRAHRRCWGPRIIDLDLLWYEGCERFTRHLVLPHPGLSRAFVRDGLAELAPGGKA